MGVIIKRKRKKKRTLFPLSFGKFQLMPGAQLGQWNMGWISTHTIPPSWAPLCDELYIHTQQTWYASPSTVR